MNHEIYVLTAPLKASETLKPNYYRASDKSPKFKVDVFRNQIYRDLCDRIRNRFERLP